MTADGAHDLAAAILLQAVRDTGRCSHCIDRERRRCVEGPWCDVDRFWRTRWARLLCDEVDLDYQAVTAWVADHRHGCVDIIL